MPPDVLPMLGQLWVDPEEFGPVLFDPELPLLGPDDGVVVDEFELVPVPPVAVERRGRAGDRARPAGDEAGGQCAEGRHVAKA